MSVARAPKNANPNIIIMYPTTESTTSINFNSSFPSMMHTTKNPIRNNINVIILP
jgi:hypothetical protein